MIFLRNAAMAIGVHCSPLFAVEEVLPVTQDPLIQLARVNPDGSLMDLVSLFHEVNERIRSKRRTHARCIKCLTRRWLLTKRRIVLRVRAMLSIGVAVHFRAKLHSGCILRQFSGTGRVCRAGIRWAGRTRIWRPGARTGFRRDATMTEFPSAHFRE